MFSFTIYPGDDNDAVRQVQIALNQQLRLCLDANGVANPTTIAAVKQFQATANLTVDGIAGPATFQAMRITFTHARLTLADFQKAADKLGVSAAAIRAVCEVEDHGSGFLEDGRPKILFERHQFYKRILNHQVAGTSSNQAQAARSAFAQSNGDICSPASGGYHGGAGEWERLNRAMAFNETAALESASYGLFQIMGFNATASGYENVQAYVRDMFGSEGDHLQAFAGFLRADPRLVAALKRKDWATYAAGYNGPAYAKNQYDKKLAVAYTKYA